MCSFYDRLTIKTIIFIIWLDLLSNFNLLSFSPIIRSQSSCALEFNFRLYICERRIKSGLLVECGKKWKIVRKILTNSAGNSAEESEIVRENAK